MGDVALVVDYKEVDRLEAQVVRHTSALGAEEADKARKHLAAMRKALMQETRVLARGGRDATLAYHRARRNCYYRVQLLEAMLTGARHRQARADVRAVFAWLRLLAKAILQGLLTPRS